MANDDDYSLAILIPLVIIMVIALVLFQAWIFMVLWGAIAGAFGWQTVGYGTSILICFFLSLVGGFFKQASKS